MKNTILKSILALFMAFIALPMMGQDYMFIYFKNGDFRKFYMKNITEITTSRFDANGVQHSDVDYQHITTLYDKYVYSLEDVDSITFTKIDEELAEHNFVSAMPTVFTLIEECETVSDVQSKIEQIKNIEGVQDAWCDGHQLFVAIAQDEVYSFHFSHGLDMSSMSETIAKMKAQKPRLANIHKSDGSQIKVAIANQIHKDEKFNKEKTIFFTPLKELLEECNIDVKYIPEPTVDFFYNNSDDPDNPNFYDYDIVILNTHGNYGPASYYQKHYLPFFDGYAELDLKCHSFVTSEDIYFVDNLTSPLWSDYYKYFKKWRDDSSYHNLTDVDINYCFCEEKRNGKNVWVAHPELTEFFFMDIARGKFKNPNSLFFNCACQSLMGENGNPSYSFANYLINNRNLGIYAGYTESTYFSSEAGTYLIYDMLCGASLEESINKLPSYCTLESIDNIRDNTKFAIIDLRNYRFSIDDFEKYISKGVSNAELKVFDKSSNLPSNYYLFPTTTIEANNELINQEFFTNQEITIEGYTTQLDGTTNRWERYGYVSSDIEIGFELGETENLNPELGIHESIKKEAVNESPGSFRFECTIPNLVPERTYYYRAYTYDGLNYNYGDIYSFKIDKIAHLELSTNTVSLKVGETSTIDITAGSGSYSIEKIEPTGVVTASISENHISIEALTGGTATITVKDDKSGDTAPIEVKVEWDHLSFAINGTVDLKVGESTTIDITSGSGSYSIEEIKPAGVVTASISENSVIIEALKAGTATITVKDDKSGEKAPIEVKVQVKDIPAEAIDLGLPSGILWASYNVGATTPEEYGSYFAWGEIEDKDVYYWTTYSHCDGVSNSCHDIGADISGTRFDVAHMRWEGEWRMPTAEEFKELVYQCDYQVTTQNGVYGFKFTGPNGNSIFFPAAGYRFNTGINKAGSSGEYWSSTVRENKNYAYDTSMSADYVYWDCYINRFAGLPVRPVKQAEPALEDLVLSTTSPISLKAGETSAVQIISGNGVYSFDNTNPKVATFEIEGNTITISAVRAGTTTITVKDDKSGKAAYIEVKVTGSVVDIPADAIDLGLKSGKKWASYNVGALSPEDYGGYFAWGETETKESYTEDNYTANVDLTEEYITVISGTEHDAARIHWGENWRMPTILEIRELVRECSSKWDTVNGVKGLRFTGPNGNSIFMPAAGAYYGNDNYYVGEDGRYWSAEQVWDGTKAAFFLYLTGGGASGDNRSSFEVGMPIRPIYCGDTDHLVDFKLSSIDPVCLPIGESHTIEITSGNNSYTILSSDESVATVGQGGWASIEQGTSGKSIVISAVATGISIITAFDNMSGQKFIIAVKVIDPNSTIDIIGHEAVDLGLPSGTLWASNNIGADKEEDYGDYFAWGETEQKDSYYSHTYAFCADKNDENSCVYLGDIAGTEFDAAHVNWGGLWHMPTQEQVKELIENCESWVTKHNGISGVLFTGPNGKSIFLPAAGFRAYSNIYSQGNAVQYWTSTQVANNTSTAYSFYTMNITNPTQARYLGLSVRPVANSNTELANLTLSDDYIRLNVGESGSVVIISGNGNYSVTSSNANVATAKLQNSASGSSIVVDALSIGEVTIFVTDNNCGQIRRIEVKVVNLVLNGHDAVDLGLTSGTMWATCNVGATAPEEFGGFYAWGETVEKESYSWGTYTHCDGSYNTCHNIGEDISGTEYDVAHVKWGGSWKMPNETQVKELLNECSSEWTKVNNVNGYRFTGPNGNSIFIPAAGYYDNAKLYRSGKAGGFWSSSNDSPKYFSVSMVFEKDYLENTAFERYYGLSIRPIVE